MMEFLYLIILLFSSFIKDIENVLLKKENINAFKDEKILLVSEEPSLLQCAQRCRFIDKNAVIDFKNSKCTCIKYDVDEGQEHMGTLTGVFINQEIMKAKKIEPLPQDPPQVTNVALNKDANQSSVADGNHAGLSVDGTTKTWSSTQSDLHPYLSVDLKIAYDILDVIIMGEKSNEHINTELVVETREKADDPWKECKNIGALKSSPFKFICDQPTTARYVQLRSTKPCVLFIYEFEVYSSIAVE